MITDIEFGQLYSIKLIEKHWPNVEFLVQINGTTRTQCTKLFSDMSIKIELFDNYNLGLNTFLANCNDEIDVYLCNIISSLTPLTIEETGFFLLPKSCIDYENSEKFLETHDLVYTINGINRYISESDGNIDELIKESKEELKTNLEYYANFASTTITIDVATNSVYKRESEINSMNSENAALYETYEEARKQNYNKLEELKNYYKETAEKYNNSMESIEKEREKLTTMQNENAELQLLNIDLNKDLIKIKTLFKDLVDNTIVPAGKEVGIHVDDFDTMFESIQNIIDNEK